jgi:O-antigen ligase
MAKKKKSASSADSKRPTQTKKDAKRAFAAPKDSKRPAVAKKQIDAAAPSEAWGMARQIAWWSILAMVFITPIAISNMSWLSPRILPLSFDQFDIIKVFMQRVFGLIALTAWVWDIALKGGKIRRTPVEWLILAFLIWVSLSTAFSIHPPTAIFGKYRRFEGLLSFFNYAIIYFLVLQLADRPSRIKRIAQALFWSSIVVAGYGLMQALGRDIMSWGTLPFEVNRSFSTYGNPDLLGGFLMFGLFISLGLALAEESLTWRGVYWFGFLMNAAVTVTAFTRSAWVGAVVGFVFIVLFAVRERAPWKLEDWAFSGTALAVAVAFVIRSLKNPNEVMNFWLRVKSIFDFHGGSAGTRFEIWSAALRATKARPFFGFGPDTFRLIFPKYKPVEYVADAGYLSVADNVHNYPLQLAAGIGIPGLLMLYGIFGWVAVRAWKLIWPRDGKNRMVYAGFWAACAAYLVHLFFGLSVTGTSFMLWTSMGVLMAPTATVVTVKPPRWIVPVAGLVTVLAVSGIAYQFVLMAADKAYLMARIGSQGAQRTAWAERAVKLNPWNDMYRAEVGLANTDEVIAALSSASQQGVNQQTAISQAQAAFGRAEFSLKETIDFVPWEYDNYVFLANLYNLGGQFFNPAYYDRAIEIGLEGKRVEPFGPAIRLQLARSYVSTGQPKKAIKELQEAFDMDPAYTDVVNLLQELYLQEGDRAAALRVLKKAEAFKPGQPGVADKLSALEQSMTAPPKP